MTDSTAAKSQSRRVVVRGFYGKGNMGDEALLRSILFHLGDEFGYKIAVNTPGVPKDDWRKLAPYRDHMVISSLDRGKVMSPDVSTFFLGGGGLGLGFGYNQLICARRAGKAFIHSGVHIHEDFFSGPDPAFEAATRSMLLLANLTTVRDRYSLDVMRRYDIPGEFLPDWAIGLPAEPWDAPVPDDYVVVTFRARPPNDAELIQPWLAELRRYIDGLGTKLVVLPFDKGDAKLAEKLGFGDNVIGNLYFEPEKAKHIISRARAVVSFGRFHPIVFGLSEHVPSFAIDYWYPSESRHKTTLLLKEEGLGAGIFHKGNFTTFKADHLVATTEALRDNLSDRRFDKQKDMLKSAAERMKDIIRSN